MVLTKRAATRQKSTKEEFLILLDAAEKLYKGIAAECPRCGKALIYEEAGAAYSVSCSDDTCIDARFRGI